MIIETSTENPLESPFQMILESYWLLYKTNKILKELETENKDVPNKMAK